MKKKTPRQCSNVHSHWCPCIVLFTVSNCVCDCVMAKKWVLLSSFELFTLNSRIHKQSPTQSEPIAYCELAFKRSDYSIVQSVADSEFPTGGVDRKVYRTRSKLFQKSAGKWGNLVPNGGVYIGPNCFHLEYTRYSLQMICTHLGMTTIDSNTCFWMTSGLFLLLFCWTKGEISCISVMNPDLGMFDPPFSKKISSPTDFLLSYQDFDNMVTFNQL